MDYPKTAADRLEMLNTLPLPDELLDMLHLAIHLSVKAKPEGGGYSYADDVKLPGASPPDPQDHCSAPGFIALECVHGNQTSKPVRCRKCEGCQHSWRGKVRRLIIDGCGRATPYMWTLTFKEYPDENRRTGKTHISGDRYDFAQKAWAKLRRKAVRRELSFRYLRVVELQTRGTPHFHLAVTDVRRKGLLLTTTTDMYRALFGIAQSAGFGPQMDFQRASLGPSGVGSYLSKYLAKGQRTSMVRADGRQIRVYNRGHGWALPPQPPTWRLRALPDTFSKEELLETELRCDCSQGLLLPPKEQASRWIRRNLREGVWLAPLSIMDYIQKETLEWDELQATLVPAQSLTTKARYSLSYPSSQVNASSASCLTPSPSASPTQTSPTPSR